MTFTLIGHCHKKNQLGIGIATYSLAVGGYCPFINPKVAAVSTQAFANPQLGPLAMRLLEMGFSPEKVVKELESHDPYHEYRQIGIVDKNGQVAGKTGGNTLPWSGHSIGEGYVAMGNVLSGSQVVEEMAAAYEDAKELDLEERILRSIEAGRDAGGQPQGQRSAALIIYDREDYSLMDLRVDAHEEPIAELCRVYALYKQYIPLYYDLRSKEPHIAPTQEEWERMHQIRT